MFWGSSQMVFLGMLLDSENQTVLIPVDKITKAKMLLNSVIGKKKITINQLQKICGFLNFLGRCVLPGRAFTQRLYYYLGGKNSQLKPHHHIRMTLEMRRDLETWEKFINHPAIFCRSFMDFTKNSDSRRNLNVF